MRGAARGALEAWEEVVGLGGVEDEVVVFLDDALDGPMGGEESDFGELDEVLDGGGRVAEEVTEVVFELVELGRFGAIGESAVNVHALALGGDVGGGNVGVDGEFKVSEAGGRFGLVVELADGAGKHLAVKLIADGIDVA